MVTLFSSGDAMDNSQKYLMLNVSTNVVDNECLWDGNTQTWTPPSGYTMLVTATTPAKVWVYSEVDSDYVLQETVGAGQIGFTWNGSVLTTDQQKPPAISNRQVTEMTINKAAECLVLVAGLATDELQQHISLGSSQEISQYIHDVGNIVAAAQSAYINNEAYSPAFPTMPTLIPNVGEQKSVEAAPYIQFITEK